MTSQRGIPIEEVRVYSGLSSAALRFYVQLGLLPQPNIQRNGRGTRVWYPQEAIGLLTVIQRLKRRGMKLREIAELLGQREVIEGDEARAMGSALVEENSEERTVSILGENIARQLPDRVVVVAVYNTELREGRQIMEPEKIVHLPKESIDG